LPVENGISNLPSFISISFLFPRGVSLLNPSFPENVPDIREEAMELMLTVMEFSKYLDRSPFKIVRKKIDN
jgi:hypothetical protein